MDTKPLVSIIILNWNGLNDTLECLQSISKIKYPNYQVIIVDNASIDNSVVEIKKQYPDIMIIVNSCNLGFSEGNNVGIRHCLDIDNKYILLLNNDTTVDPDFLCNLISGAEENPSAGIYSGLIYYYNNPESLWYAGAEWQNDGFKHIHDLQYPHDQQPSYLTDYICGCMLLTRKDVINDVGLLDPKFFLTYEETDWCYRAKHRGYQCSVIPTAKIWHKISVSFGGNNSPLQNYFFTRNFLLWAKRNLPTDTYKKLRNKKIKEIIPSINLKSPLTNNPIKSFVWGIFSYCKIISVKKEDPIWVAKSHGLLDFFLSRFGNCPDSIRRLGKR